MFFLKNGKIQFAKMWLYWETDFLENAIVKKCDSLKNHFLEKMFLNNCFFVELWFFGKFLISVRNLNFFENLTRKIVLGLKNFILGKILFFYKFFQKNCFWRFCNLVKNVIFVKFQFFRKFNLKNCFSFEKRNFWNKFFWSIFENLYFDEKCNFC